VVVHFLAMAFRLNFNRATNTSNTNRPCLSSNLKLTTPNRITAPTALAREERFLFLESGDRLPAYALWRKIDRALHLSGLLILYEMARSAYHFDSHGRHRPTRFSRLLGTTQFRNFETSPKREASSVLAIL
jgi:hypothetical protein